MDLIPKALIVGVFAAVQPSPNPPVTPEKLNRIWSELSPRHGYQQFQLLPDGSGAQILGGSADDGVTIQLPLLQVRSSIPLEATNAAADAQAVLRTIGSHLGVGQFFNLGVKYVYLCPVPDKDARGFVLGRLLSKTEEDLAALQQGGELWAGVKYGVTSATGEAQYNVLIEPFLADNTLLYIDVDSQFPGSASIDAVKERAAQTEEYITGPLRSYLDATQAGL